MATHPATTAPHASDVSSSLSAHLSSSDDDLFIVTSSMLDSQPQKTEESLQSASQPSPFSSPSSRFMKHFSVQPPRSNTQFTQADKMKTSFVSWWNTMKYGLSSKPTHHQLASRKPIFLLGKRYVFDQPTFYYDTAADVEIAATSLARARITVDTPASIDSHGNAYGRPGRPRYQRQLSGRSAFPTVASAPCLPSTEYSVSTHRPNSNDANVVSCNNSTEPYDYSNGSSDLPQLSRVPRRNAKSSRSGNQAEFYLAFRSLLWMTYRKDFPYLPGSRLSTDCGWGCMLRTGQMILAQALIWHFLGREWRFGSGQSSSDEAKHREVIKWFVDSDSLHCPLSIHNLLLFASFHEKKAGDWFGPATVVHILQEAVTRAAIYTPVLEQVCVYIASDCTLYEQDALHLATTRKSSVSSDSDDYWRSLIIFVPVRLGEARVNPAYIPCLKELFAQRWCLGIIGGRPKHSMYFVGYQEDSLLYLDPHFCQDALSMSNRQLPMQTYHCSHPQKMNFSKMDPSCTLGFYCHTRADFEEFVNTVQPQVSPKSAPGTASTVTYPLFVIERGSRSGLNNGQPDNPGMVEQYLRVSKTKERAMSTDSTRQDDYVFL